MWKRLGWVGYVAVVVTLASAGILVWSWVCQTSTWESGFLVQVGSTLVLAAPLVVVGRLIERRLDTVGTRQEQIAQGQQATASKVDQLSEDVARTQEDLRLTREQLRQVVRDRVAAQRAEDSARFGELGQRPSRDSVLDSLNRAHELNLISASGCRVSLFGTGAYLRFLTVYSGLNSNRALEIILIAEHINADMFDQMRWEDGQTAADVAVAVAEMMQRADIYPGDRTFDAGKIFEDLAKLLQLVHGKVASSGGAFSLNYVIQACWPQWVVTDNGVYCIEYPYEVHASRLHEKDWISHMRGKAWLDNDSFEEALATGRALYEAGKLAVQPPGLLGGQLSPRNPAI